MTCAHVLGLIDAGPFADYPRAHLEAAWQHARQCATCGPALNAATALTAELTALPQPAPPPDLAAGVLARIASIEERRTAASAVRETPRHAEAVNRSVRLKPDTTDRSVRLKPDTTDWSPWLTIAGALAAGLAILSSGAQIRLYPPGFRGTMADLVAMASPVPSVLALLACLGVYVAGLFAPLKQAAEKRRLN